MKITVCKEMKYKPSGVTAMCSTGEILVVFRNNKSIEMIQNITFKTFLYLESEDVVVQSVFYSEEMCLMLLRDGRMKVMNVKNLLMTEIKLEYAVGYFVKDKSVIYCYTRNGLILELDINNSFSFKVVQKFSRTVTSMIKKDILLLGDEKGRVTFLDVNEGIKIELEISKGSINSIIHIEEDKFVALTGVGEVIYFDSNLNSILQKIQVRETALNCGIFFKGSLHLTGADSRIICYRRTKNLFQKSYQADKHVLEIKSMCRIGDSIFTGGLDGIIGIFVPGDHRYLGLRVFDKTPSGRFHNLGYNFVLINNINFAEIFRLEEPLRNPNLLETSFNTTIKLDKKYLEDLSVKNIKGTNECRIYFDSQVFYLDTDGKILVYTNSKSTKLVEVTPKIHQDTYFDFPPSKYIAITPSSIILQSLDFKIRIISRNDFGKVIEIPYEDLEDEIKVVDEWIIFKKSKKIYSIEKSGYEEIPVEGLVVDALMVEDNFYILSKKDLLHYTLYKIGEETKAVKSFNFTTYDILNGLLEHNQDVFYTTQSSLTNSKNGSTFDLGSVIYSTGSLGNSLAVLKDDWSYLKNELGDRVVKNKWKSR